MEHQSGTCVDEHSMDQVIIYMALAQGRSCVKGPGKEARTSLHVDTAIHMGKSPGRIYMYIYRRHTCISLHLPTKINS